MKENPKYNSVHPFPLEQMKISDSWFNHYVDLVRTSVIPYQYRALHDEIEDAAPSYAVRNLELAAEKIAGKHIDNGFKGFVFQDSDIAKWLEAVAYSLATHPDEKLKAQADELIAKVGRAQCEDGYLNTHFTLNAEEYRWKNLADCHELYVAGHFIEAAVAYYEATGERELLDIVCRFTDLICEVFGSKEGQIPGYPGHQEIELALVRLWQVTKVDRYLDLAQYFIYERGADPNYLVQERHQEDFYEFYPGTKGRSPILPYHQAEVPVMEQKHAEGHAVRATYMYIGMAELAAATHDQALLDKTIELWEDVTQHQMYVTGGIGQSGILERFTTPNDLPNDANYSETCASIALALLSLRLGQITRDARFHDIAELELFNGIASGISQDGTRFFYVNPMEVWPDNCMPDTSRGHVKATRQKWFSCACCPPNLARTYSGLGRYLLSGESVDGVPTLYVQQYVGQTATLNHHGHNVEFKLTGDYALEGKVTVEVTTEADMQIALRIPAWSTNWTVSHADGTYTASTSTLNRNYLYLHLSAGNHTIDLDFGIQAEYLIARPEVRADRGLVALRRGPLIWAVEQEDNGENLAALRANVEAIPELDGKAGIYPRVVAKGFRETYDGWKQEDLYKPYTESVLREESVDLVFIPYAYWGNRSETPGEMRVWLRR